MTKKLVKNSSIDLKSSGLHKYDFLNFPEKNVTFNVASKLCLQIEISNISDGSSIEFFVGSNSEVNLTFFINDGICKFSFKGMLYKNSQLNVNGVDFSLENTKVNSNIILFGDSSSSVWNFSSLSFNGARKEYDISFDHIGKSTTSKMNNYGVAKDASTLFFEGSSHIEHTAVKANAKQIAKIIIFDEKCYAKSDPILKIDNNDVQAGHGAVVGTLNPDHMFYLCSRGVSEKDARNLITAGYLKPVLKSFNKKDELYLNHLLEERI